MSKLRSFFCRDLDSLRMSITLILAMDAQRELDSSDLDGLFNRLESVFLTMNNRDDLFRKK